MPDGVILEHELACKRGIGVERYWSRLIELPVAERPDGGCRRRAVAPEQVQSHLPGDGIILLGMPRIHLVDGILGHACHRVASGEGLC